MYLSSTVLLPNSEAGNIMYLKEIPKKRIYIEKQKTAQKSGKNHLRALSLPDADIEENYEQPRREVSVNLVWSIHT